MKLTQDQAYSIIREAARDTATNHKDPHQRSASLIATTYSIYDITPSVSTPPINLGQEEDLFCALKAFISARVARAYPGESTFIKVAVDCAGQKSTLLKIIEGVVAVHSANDGLVPSTNVHAITERVLQRLYLLASKKKNHELDPILDCLYSGWIALAFTRFKERSMQLERPASSASKSATLEAEVTNLASHNMYESTDTSTLEPTDFSSRTFKDADFYASDYTMHAVSSPSLSNSSTANSHDSHLLGQITTSRQQLITDGNALSILPSSAAPTRTLNDLNGSEFTPAPALSVHVRPDGGASTSGTATSTGVSHQCISLQLARELDEYTALPSAFDDKRRDELLGKVARYFAGEAAPAVPPQPTPPTLWAADILRLAQAAVLRLAPPPNILFAAVSLPDGLISGSRFIPESDLGHPLLSELGFQSLLPANRDVVRGVPHVETSMRDGIVLNSRYHPSSSLNEDMRKLILEYHPEFQDTFGTAASSG